MGFRGEEYAFGSPAAAVAGMIARLRPGAAMLASGMEACRLAGARGRILAEAVTADRDSPAFDHSAMDGYAVRLADVRSAAGARIEVVGESRIGQAPPAMPRGVGAVRVATGAAVPAGAEAVVKREDVIEHGAGGGVAAIVVDAAAAGRLGAGENIRRRGDNARAGDVLVEAGTVLTAAAIGTIAAAMDAGPRVWARLRVAVVTTGDELAAAGEPPCEFEIRNSNGPVVGAILGAQAWLEVVSNVQVRDEAAGVARALRDALAKADAVVLSGGVSMGHRDPVRSAVEEAGGEVVFHGLPQRPGKPTLGAVVRRSDGASVPVFGLPGNPISAMVTCTRMVVPVLAACAGAARWPEPVRVELANADGKTLDLWWHRLVRVNGDGRVALVDGRGSGDIAAGGRADGFIEVPPGAGTGEGLFPYYVWAV